MNEPKPLLVLLIVQGLLGLWLAGWWLGLSPAERRRRLGVVLVEEHVTTVPPDRLFAQVEWLYHHRLQRLTSMVGVLVVAALVGMGEGIARRQRDVLGGFLFWWWVIGGAGLVLLLGSVGGYLIAPWALHRLVVASGLAGLVGLTGYALACGRPYIP